MTQLAHGRAAAGPDVPLRERRLAAYLRPLGSLRCRRGRTIGGFSCRRGRRRPGRFLPTSVRRKCAFGRKAPHGLVGMDGIAYQQVEQAGAHYDGHARRPHGKADAALGQGVHHAAGRLQAERAAARKHHGMHRLYHVLGLEQVGLARGRAASAHVDAADRALGRHDHGAAGAGARVMRVADAEGGQVGRGWRQEAFERFFRWKGRFVPPIVHRQRPQRQHASLRQRLALRLGTVCGSRPRNRPSSHSQIRRPWSHRPRNRPQNRSRHHPRNRPQNHRPRNRPCRPSLRLRLHLRFRRPPCRPWIRWRGWPRCVPS